MAETGTALMRADSSVWHIACNREPVVRSLVALPKITRDAAPKASDALGLGRSRFCARPVTSTLLERPKGFPKGRSRLDADVERVIDAEIEGFFLRRPKPTLAQLVRQIWHACHEHGLQRPTRRSIAARVATIERDRLIKARDGAKAATDRYRPVTRSYTAERPLEIVQMDHTLADIIIVDEHFRRPLCRPTLTLQIDVATGRRFATTPKKTGGTDQDTGTRNAPDPGKPNDCGQQPPRHCRHVHRWRQ